VGAIAEGTGEMVMVLLLSVKVAVSASGLFTVSSGMPAFSL
jgi:hypothetical protein